MPPTGDTVPAYTIRAAEWPRDATVARRLLRNYAAHLERIPHGAGGICLTNYEAELDLLPFTCVEPDGVLLLVWIGDEPAGCVQVRRCRDLPDACEMKRMWTEPMARGKSLGRALAAAAIAWARSHGAERLLLDTVESAMPAAAALYRSLGFTEIQRYNDNPVGGLTFLELKLR